MRDIDNSKPMNLLQSDLDALYGKSVEMFNIALIEEIPDPPGHLNASLIL